MTTQEKTALIDAQGVTLNGIPAKVVGRLMPFARVRQDGPPGEALDVEFAWGTVQHVISTGGAFKS